MTHGGRVGVKKSHKSKARKSDSARRHRPRDPAAELAPHSSRRAPASARPDPRRTHAARRPESATVYRRANPLQLTSTSDRQAFRLLLLPFVIMTLALAVLPSLHVFPTLKDLITATPMGPATLVGDVAELPPRTIEPAVVSLAKSQPQVIADAAPASSMAWFDPELPHANRPSPPPVLPSTSGPAGALATVQPQLPSASEAGLSTPPLAATGPHTQIVVVAAALPTAVAEARYASSSVPMAGDLPRATPRWQLPSPASRTQLAMLAPAPAPGLLSPVPPRPYETSCPVAYGSAAPDEPGETAMASSASFGMRLATAAAAQTSRFVLYDDKYRQIARSGGDVPPFYGVCTDVVVRAYRSLGVDLQVLVQASRLGAGDPNIDHRRTETLRRYFSRYGQTLVISPHGEDYQPGDIVTYWRPQNSGSRSHIAVVAATIGPSGRPMIIHNRGWGPQMEDALFVDRITGHYRYDAAARPPVPPQMASSPARPFAAARATTPVTMPAPSPTPMSPKGL